MNARIFPGGFVVLAEQKQAALDNRHRAGLMMSCFSIIERQREEVRLKKSIEG